MATSTLGIGTTATKRLDGYPVGGVTFDLAAVMLSGWFVIGLFLDGWAHNNNRVDNTFFTPWHAVLYSGVAAVGLFLAFFQYRNMTRGYSWSRALPEGHGLSRWGVVIFFIAGGFDFLWHSLFGFEAGVDALLSPSHLMLACGAFLFMLGSLRAGWLRSKTAHGWRELLPVVLSVLFLFSLFTFFTQYANFYSNIYFITNQHIPSFDAMKIAPVVVALGVLVQAVITMGWVLFAIRRWDLPRGALTLIFTANAIVMFLMYWGDSHDYGQILIAPVLVGLLADVLLVLLKPRENVTMFRVFAFIVPFVQFGLMFGLMLLTTGIWLSIHLWLGVTFLSAASCVFLSYLMILPKFPVGENLLSS